MKLKLEQLGLSPFKVILTSILCLIGFLSLIYVALTTNMLFSYFYCLATVGFCLLPIALTLIFRWRMNNLFFLIFEFYAFGPLLGAVYNFYYFTSWWDILLHLLAGTVFAVVGAQLTYTFNKNNKTSYALAAIFGVLISIAIGVFWEFFEFGCDQIFHSDMQADTVIHELFTKINTTDGGRIPYTGITQTIVNADGSTLVIPGYLDIGLLDTMFDLIIETSGAFIFLFYVIIDRNRHPMIVSLEKKNKKNHNIDIQSIEDSEIQ